MKYLKQYRDNAVYARAAAALLRVLAEYEESVPKLEEEKVDESMKELMFDYNDDMDVFHNAQRVCLLWILDFLFCKDYCVSS